MSKKQMLAAHTASAVGDNTVSAWWYINPSTIDVLCLVNDGKGGPNYCGEVRLTRRQLQAALKAMQEGVK